MSKTARIKLITFDAFNTLFKPKGSVSTQYVEEASNYGIKVTKDQITQHFGPAYKKQVSKAPFYGIHQGMTPKQWWKELVYATFINSGVLPKDLDLHYDTIFDRLYLRFTSDEGYAIFPEVPSVLDELKRKGFKMGVISNSDERVIQVMENLKLSQYFDFILTSSIAGYEKPDKRIFDQAIKLGGNVSPKDTLHVGDDIKADYFGSLDAGMNAAVLDREPLEGHSYINEGFNSTMKEQPKKISTLCDLYPLLV